MQKFILSCSSPCSLPFTYFDERNISVVPYPYIIDGVEYLDDSGRNSDLHEFYDQIRAGAMPSTSLVNEMTYSEYFKKLLKDGDVLHLEFSSGLTGSCNNAFAAAREINENSPEHKLIVVDSLCACAGYGLFVDAVADLRDGGADIDAAASWAEEHKLNVHHWFMSYDLSHYKRGGRISGAAAVIGTMLNICPLMNVTFDGKLMPRFKIRGKQKAMLEAVNMMEKYADGGAAYSGKCFINNADCPDDAEHMKKLVMERFPNIGEIRIVPIGRIIGSHTGPGTVSVFFFGSKRVD